jgi:hypothetical protein
MTTFGNLLYRLENIVQRNVQSCDEGLTETFVIDTANQSYFLMLTGGNFLNKNSLFLLIFLAENATVTLNSSNDQQILLANRFSDDINFYEFSTKSIGYYSIVISESNTTSDWCDLKIFTQSNYSIYLAYAHDASVDESLQLLTTFGLIFNRNPFLSK